MAAWHLLSYKEKCLFLETILALKPKLCAQIQLFLKSTGPEQNPESSLLELSSSPEKVLQAFLEHVEDKTGLYYSNFTSSWIEIRERLDEVLAELYAKRRQLRFHADRPSLNGIKNPPETIPKFTFDQSLDRPRSAQFSAYLRSKNPLPFSKNQDSSYSFSTVLAVFAANPQLLLLAWGLLISSSAGDFNDYRAQTKPTPILVYKDILRYLHRQTHLPLTKPQIWCRARTSYESMRVDLESQMQRYSKEISTILPQDIAELCAVNPLYAQAYLELKKLRKQIIARKVARLNLLQKEINELEKEVGKMDSVLDCYGFAAN